MALSYQEIPGTRRSAISDRIVEYREKIIRGLMTINDARRAEGLPPMDDPKADVYYVPVKGCE